jgi:hypothetical protein
MNDSTFRSSLPFKAKRASVCYYSPVPPPLPRRPAPLRSAGVASAADLGKLVFANSIVQLGLGIGGISGASATAKSAEAPALSIRGTLVAAVIRYGVDVSRRDFVTQANGIRVRYRDGSGFVVVRLVVVDMDTGVESDLQGIDSRVGFNPSDVFRVVSSINEGGAPLSPVPNHPAFYIELTLGVLQPPNGLVPFPPAVQAIEVGVEESTA